MENFSPYFLFVKEIHRSLVDSPHSGAPVRNFDVFFHVSLDKLLEKHRFAGYLRRHDGHVTSL